MSDKAEKTSRDKIKTCIKNLQKEQSHKNIMKLNQTILVIQNYYSIVTHIIKDLSNINFITEKIMHNRLKNIYKRATFEELSERMKEIYKGYNPKLYKIDGIVIVPTYAQKYKRLMNFSQKTNSYTTEGRYFIHDELEIIDKYIIKEIKDSYEKLKSIEYNDNRISKFIYQYGRCAISNIPLQNKDWHCHHIKLKRDGGTARYRNLTVIKSDIHDAIHSSNTDKIKNIMSKYKLDKNQKRRFDKLRLEINLEVYYGCL